jgi:DNA-binding IclR family transcriptional regulator
MAGKLSFDDYVVDVLLRDLVGHDHRPVAFLVYLWLVAEQQRKDGVVQISYQEIAENIGVSKSSVQSAVRWLVRRKLLAASKENATATPRYTVLAPWRESARRSAARAAR